MATTLFTEKQRAAVDHVLDTIANEALSAINREAPRISAMDTRPVGGYNPSDPNDGPEKWHFRYVAQGMLEDLIERLQEHV